MKHLLLHVGPINALYSGNLSNILAMRASWTFSWKRALSFYVMNRSEYTKGLESNKPR
jgi:hypothetical protein